MYYRFKLKRVLGSQHAGQYTSIIAMVVESELLYTAYLIVYIVPFIMNNSLANAFAQGPSAIQVRGTANSTLSISRTISSTMWLSSQSVSALMIVYRVADGKGWKR